MGNLDYKNFAVTYEKDIDAQSCALIEAGYFDKVRMMPDTHIGKGANIGFTAPIKDGAPLDPNIVGVDIGCGLLAVTFDKGSFASVDLAALDAFIRENIGYGSYPSGGTVVSKNIEVPERFAHLGTDALQIGSLGGGNHYIELGCGQKDDYLIIHSGSRHYGQTVNRKHVKLVDPSVGGLIGAQIDDYLEDMWCAADFASTSRKMMAQKIYDYLGLRPTGHIETVHNLIFQDGILRKGAVQAHEGQLLLIAINMAQGTLIAEGLGNEDWNYSAPHGAGRLLGRRAAMRELSAEDAQEQMKDVYSSNIPIDEAPDAYKNMEEIVRSIEGNCVNILDVAKPIYNFKG